MAKSSSRVRAIVLLDGLDEAANDRDRRRVAKVVQRASTAFRGCRFVLTSRPAAYQRTAVLPGFAMVKIEPLEDSAIEHFLDCWCRALFAESPSQVAAHREELLLALRSRPEIRRLARDDRSRPGYAAERRRDGFRSTAARCPRRFRDLDRSGARGRPAGRGGRGPVAQGIPARRRGIARHSTA